MLWYHTRTVMIIMEWIKEYSTVINALASVGAFISALVALFTLKEIKKQRRSAYKPELFIKSFIVELSKSPLVKNKDELLRYKISNFNDYSVNYNEVESQVYVTYIINNLGFGIAKNVKCKWHFDFEKAIKMIKEELPNEFEISKHTGSFYLTKKNDDNFFYSANHEQDVDTTDIIAPIQISPNNHYHSIPEIIIFSHMLYLSFKLNLIKSPAEQFHIYDFESFPKPTLAMEYQDLDDKKYKKTISFNVEGVTSQIGEELDLNREFCMLQFNVE